MCSIPSSLIIMIIPSRKPPTATARVKNTRSFTAATAVGAAAPGPAGSSAYALIVEKHSPVRSIEIAVALLKSLADTCHLLSKHGLVLEADRAARIAGGAQKNQLGRGTAMLPLMHGSMRWFTVVVCAV